MKKIIDGKRYNTDTATLIAEWTSDHYQNDLNYYEESLYKTHRGRYFVAGSGNANSKYSEPCEGNSRRGGSGIEPLSEDEAKRWLEDHDFVDELEECFGESIEDA